MPKYSYFIAFSYHAAAKVTKMRNGRREPAIKSTTLSGLGIDRYPVVEGRSNMAMLFESPINLYQQILDAQQIILEQNELFLDVSIQFYQFLYEEPEEGNHESGPEQEEEHHRWTSHPPGNIQEGRLGGRYGKAST